jgi:hypothetical protein
MTGCTVRTEKGSVTKASASTMATRVPETFTSKGLFGPYRLRRVRPATTVGSAKGRSMTALTMRFPTNSSRTMTQAMSKPAKALNTATVSEQTTVSSRADRDSDDVASCQKADGPPVKA